MANIQSYLNKIKQAVFGKEIRSSIADGIDVINKEVESTTSKQNNLLNIFNQLIINAGNSNAEIVAARVDQNTGKTYNQVGERLDDLSLNKTNVILSNLEPQDTNDNTYWLEEIGEVNFNLGDGVSVNNATTSTDEPSISVGEYWFDVE